MIFNDKFDFCLIPNPYNGQGKGIVFITARGLDYIDETITSDESYKKLRSFMENINFFEIEFCSFESKESILGIEEDVITKMESRGLRYSKALEIKINKEMNEMNIIEEEKKIMEPVVYHTHPSFLTNFPAPIDPPTYKVPQIGEKITLYFYLFLECHFINEDDCVILLNGEFNTSENNHYRNFLNISKADFVRIHSDLPGVISLQSVKQYKDFINDINILHSGKFKVVKPYMTEIGQKGYKTKEYQYSFVEIKKNINPDSNILIQVNLNGFYNQMLDRSKAIKKELFTVGKKTVSIDFIKTEINQMKSKLENKMIDFADMDEYERASYVKKNIILLDDKLKIINAFSEKDITMGDYMKIFTLN